MPERFTKLRPTEWEEDLKRSTLQTSWQYTPPNQNHVGVSFLNNLVSNPRLIGPLKSCFHESRWIYVLDRMLCGISFGVAPHQVV